MAALVALGVAQRYLSLGFIFLMRSWDQTAARLEEPRSLRWRRRDHREPGSMPPFGASSWPAEANRAYLIGRLAAQTHEELVCLFYDAECRLIGETSVEGTLTSVAVERSSLIEATVRLNPRYALLAHNHPGGDSRPSKEDVEATRSLHRLFGALGIVLVDHVIVAQREQLFSFFAAGLM